MNNEKYCVFDPMDPVDLAIMVSPELDHTVDELTKYAESAAVGIEGILSEAYETEIGNDQFEAEDEDGVGLDDDDSTDLPGDYAAEDAEDYSAAEMELLAGDFGNPIESVDDIEFCGEEE